MKPSRRERMSGSLSQRPVGARALWALLGTSVAFLVGWLVEQVLPGPTNWVFLILMTICIGAVLLWQYVIAPTRWARIHRD